MRRLTRDISLFLTFCTGLSALVYEVTWQRYLANFLGSGAQATAMILAVFLGGLCVGYRMFGGLSERYSPAMLVLICGLAELAIGVWALVFPFLYRSVWQFSGVVDPLSTFSLLWEVLVGVVLVGVPTVLMGGTLPLLTQGLSNDLQDARNFHARIYAANTGGAFLGCLLAAFYFLPNWGLHGTMQYLGILNMIAGLILAAVSLPLERKPPLPPAAPAPAAEPASEEGKLGMRHACWVAAVSGFCSLCLQTVFIRLIGITMGSSEYAFAMVVAVFVGMLSMGSWLVACRGSKSIELWKNQLFVFAGAAVVYLTASYWPYSCYLTRLNFTSLMMTFYVYHGAMFLLLALVLAVPVGMMGATMPRLFGSVSGSQAEIGANVGRLYAWNTIGCVLGALCGGYWFLYFWNLDTVYRICLFAFALNVAVSYPWRKHVRGRREFAMCLLIAVLFVTSAVIPDWNKFFLGTGLFRARRTYPFSMEGAAKFYRGYLDTSEQIFYRDGPATTVSVGRLQADQFTQRMNGGSKIALNLKVNGKSDGETSYGDMRTMRVVGHLPMLLSVKPVKRVAIIGFGLGISAGAASLYPEVEDIQIMEISPAVIWASPLFDFANNAITKNPKAHITLGDAYRTLMASPEKFSVINSEPSNPWVTGVERLFSKDFYEVVKSKLEPNGIYTQWIHEYSLREDALKLVFRTFMESFPNVRVFRTDRDIVMLGSMEELGPASITAFFDRYNNNTPVRQALAQVLLPDPAALFGLEIWTSPEQFSEGPIQTLDFPRLALMAGRDFFLNEDVDLAELLSTPINRLWAHAAAKKSLIAYTLPEDRVQRANVVESYARAACDIFRLSLFADWNTRVDSCRAALVAAAINGQITELPGKADKNTVDFLRQLREANLSPDLSSWMKMVPSLTVAQAESFFELFETYDSIFERFSVEKLLVTAVTCMNGTGPESVGCRAHLVRTLSVTGHPKLAREVFNELIPAYENELAPDYVQLLRTLLAAAERAARK